MLLYFEIKNRIIVELSCIESIIIIIVLIYDFVFINRNNLNDFSGFLKFLLVLKRFFNFGLLLMREEVL